MGAQDQTEKVLRKIHVLLSKSEQYEDDPKKVIIDKEEMLGILGELNNCIYGIMDEYELTQRSRDKAEREFRRQGNEIVTDASRKAEDIYAASVMYTDEALNRVYDIMHNASESIKDIYEEIDYKLKAQERDLKTNQLELKSSLQGLVDTDKYLTLIEQRNREIKRQESEGKKNKGNGNAPSERSIYADRSTGIKVNTEVLEKLGYTADEQSMDVSEIPEVPGVDPNTSAMERFKKAEINVRVNEDYIKATQAAAKSEAEASESAVDISNTDNSGADAADVDISAATMGAMEAALEADADEEAKIRAELDADYFDWVETEGTSPSGEAVAGETDNNEDPEELTGSIQSVLKKLRDKKLL